VSTFQAEGNPQDPGTLRKLLDGAIRRAGGSTNDLEDYELVIRIAGQESLRNLRRHRRIGHFQAHRCPSSFRLSAECRFRLAAEYAKYAVFLSAYRRDVVSDAANAAALA